MLLSFLVWIYFLFMNNSTNFFKWLIRLFVMFLFATLIILGASADSESSFFGKILRSFQEIIPNEDQNLHSNWRAVESAVALNSILSGSFFEILFGKGLDFVCLLDLK